MQFDHAHREGPVRAENYYLGVEDMLREIQRGLVMHDAVGANVPQQFLGRFTTGRDAQVLQAINKLTFQVDHSMGPVTGLRGVRLMLDDGGLCQGL